MEITVLLCLSVIFSLMFTYTNGFQDGSSVAAGAIGSRALTPVRAILLVSAFEFLGAMLGGSAVAGTIQAITNFPGNPKILPVLCSGLVAAIAWNFITRWLKVPSSSTHALVGGLIGAIASESGTKYLIMGHFGLFDPSGIAKVIITLFASPLIGFVAGIIALEALTILLMKATMRINTRIKQGQWLSTALLAFGHGANDSQKSMGIIVLALNAAGAHQGLDIPLYVRASTGLAMVLGVFTLAPGIVRRVGSGIYKMRNIHGLAAEAASAIVVVTGSATGGPVSASQVIASCVMGVGGAARFRGVQWLIAKDMLVAWFMTIPCSAVLAAVIHAMIFNLIPI